MAVITQLVAGTLTIAAAETIDLQGNGCCRSWWMDASGIIVVSPTMGARFAQYCALMTAGVQPIRPCRAGAFTVWVGTGTLCDLDGCLQSPIGLRSVGRNPARCRYCKDVGCDPWEGLP